MLKVHAQKLGAVVILRVQGQIVIGELTTLSKTVSSQSEASVLVLDLARVSRIDAAGLGMMLELREQTQSKGIEFRIMNVTKLVQQVLEITRLNTVFEVTSERDVQSLATPVQTDEGSEGSLGAVLEGNVAEGLAQGS
jgi:anti-sigma B factor antagonist